MAGAEQTGRLQVAAGGTAHHVGWSVEDKLVLDELVLDGVLFTRSRPGCKHRQTQQTSNHLRPSVSLCICLYNS